MKPVELNKKGPLSHLFLFAASFEGVALLIAATIWAFGTATHWDGQAGFVLFPLFTCLWVFTGLAGLLSIVYLILSYNVSAAKSYSALVILVANAFALLHFVFRIGA